MRLFLCAIGASFACAHYGMPPCQSDEASLSITGSGVMCAPRCGAGDACPQDLPPGDKVKPRCALNGPDGHKYCALTCYFGKCPDGATCKWPSGAIVGYCEYPKNKSFLSQDISTISMTTGWETNLSRPRGGQNVVPSASKASWNISVACPQVCQPDPEYSKTEWCKHKDRGGCCVEVDPSWDKVPGYKHMGDFCDKLCMPNGPGKLAICEPPAEFKNLAAIDPLDALDQFYEHHQDQCAERIGDWQEPNCRKAVIV
jgi:hypothetical protein